MIIDKQAAKTRDHILLVKINNDGYDLGDKRNPITANDLPQALELIEHYQQLNQLPEDNTFSSNNAQLISKQQLKENDFNLSFDRYKTSVTKLSSHYPMVKLEELIDTITPPKKFQKEEYQSSGLYPIIDQSQDYIIGYTNDHNSIIIVNNPLLIFGDHTCIVKLVSTNFAQGADGIKILQCKDSILPKYLYVYLKNKPLQSDGYRRHFSLLKLVEIPLPPMEIQQKIVAEIEQYQKVIDGAKLIVDNYTPKININPEWQTAKLSDICEVKSGGTPSRDNPEYWNGSIPWVKTGQINFNYINNAEEFITEQGLENSSTKMIPKGTILMAMYGQGITRGRVAVLNIDASINQACAAIEIRNLTILNRDFLYYSLMGMYNYLREISDARGGNQSNLNALMIKELILQIPSLKEQEKIVAELEHERKLVDNAKQLIDIMQSKINILINSLWKD